MLTERERRLPVPFRTAAEFVKHCPVPSWSVSAPLPTRLQRLPSLTDGECTYKNGVLRVGAGSVIFIFPWQLSRLGL